MDKIIQKYAPRNDLPLFEAARLNILPDRLQVWHIACLYFPEEANKQKRNIFCAALNEAASKNELKAEIIEIKRLVRTARRWIDGSFIDPYARNEYETLRYYVVHKDDYKTFLQNNGEWPLAMDTLISKWYPEAVTPLLLPSTPKKKQMRGNEMHMLIERICEGLYKETKYFPKTRDVFRALKNRKDDFDTDCILLDINYGTNKIEWQCTSGSTKEMQYETFENIISKIRQRFKRKTHR